MVSANIINLDEERLLRVYDRIGNVIVDYINDMDLVWEIEKAREIYFGNYTGLIDFGKPNIGYKPFIQWLIFSYKLNSGYSLIDCIYKNYINKLNNYERDALASLMTTCESLYKVYSLEEDRIMVKDVITNKKIYIWNNSLINNVKRYTGLFMRIVNINNKNIPIPGYSVMSNSFLKDTEQYIQERYEEFRSFNNGDNIHSFLNSNSLMMHRYFLHYNI